MLIDVDGRRAYAYTGGRPFDPARPTVVLVHGAQNDHTVWALQSRWLAHHGWSVLAVDLPGHGRSAGPPLEDVPALAGWTLRLLAAAGARRAAIAGHSLGSLVALEAAGQAPDTVAGVALVATAFPMKVSDALLAAARDDEPAAYDMINRWSHAKLVHRPGTPAPGFSMYVQSLRLMERQAPGVLRVDFAACDAWTGGLERAKALRCPVLFVLAERDMMTPPKAARGLIEAIPGATVVTIPGAGHQVMGEAPEETRDALAAWLRRIPATGPAVGG